MMLPSYVDPKSIADVAVTPIADGTFVIEFGSAPYRRQSVKIRRTSAGLEQMRSTEYWTSDEWLLTRRGAVWDRGSGNGPLRWAPVHALNDAELSWALTSAGIV
jgi:hypothetical protein